MAKDHYSIGESPDKDTFSLYALQEVTSAPRVLVAGEQDVLHMTQVGIWIRLGRIVTNAFTDGVKFRVEVSRDETGNRWIPSLNLKATTAPPLLSRPSMERVWLIRTLSRWHLPQALWLVTLYASTTPPQPIANTAA